jgi:hypothetical protein
MGLKMWIVSMENKTIYIAAIYIVSEFFFVTDKL